MQYVLMHEHCTAGTRLYEEAGATGGLEEESFRVPVAVPLLVQVDDKAPVLIEPKMLRAQSTSSSMDTG